MTILMTRKTQCMKKTMGNLFGRLALGITCATLVQSLQAATIFNNSVNDLLQRFNPGTLEVGDQIVLAGTQRYLTNFAFEYWGTSTTPGVFAGSIQARVRFYLNDGTPFNGYATPSDQFYDSDWFPVSLPTDRNTFVFSSGADFPTGGVFIPGNEMTWTVQFQGMGAGDAVGVDLYSLPVLGQDYPDYWENTISGWALKNNSVAMDFAALMEAQVPEPSSLALWIGGGIALLILANRTRHQK